MAQRVETAATGDQEELRRRGGWRWQPPAAWRRAMTRSRADGHWQRGDARRLGEELTAATIGGSPPLPPRSGRRHGGWRANNGNGGAAHSGRRRSPPCLPPSVQDMAGGG